MMLMKRFRQIYVEITNVCNLACPFCPGHGRPPTYMDAGLFADIVRQAQPLTEQLLLHVMGEPLLHPELPALLELCAGHDLPVAITTNGLLLAEAGCLFKPIVRQVNISLHALQQLISPDDREQRLEAALDFARRALARRPELYLNFRLWDLETSGQALDSEINQWLRRRLEETFGTVVPAAGHSAGRKSRRLLGRLYLHLDTRFEWPDINSDRPQKSHGFCHALGTHFAILADGEVVPCCLDRDGVTSLGNCRRQPVANILNGPRANAMLAGFRNGLLLEPLCRKCAYCARFKVSRHDRPAHLAPV